MVTTRNVDTVDAPQSLSECLLSQARINPTQDAVVTSTFKLSYLELSLLVKAQAKKFNGLGISENSVLGIQCADEVQHLILCLAASYIGCTSCTIPTYEAEQTCNAIIKNCGATNIVDESSAVNAAGPYVNVESKLNILNSAQLLFSTSGTTGNPKLVVHNDQDLVAQACRHINASEERFLCLASIEHNFAKRHRLYCVAMGATNIFLKVSQDVFVEQCLSLNVNVMHVSVFQAQELLAIPNINNLSNIRLKLGGSHVDSSLRKKLRSSITQKLQAGYGTTETGAIAFTDPNDIEDNESVGKPLPGIEVRIVTPKKKTLKNGEQGEITIRCSGMFRQYLDNLELTNSRLQDDWFYTGDIGYLDKKQRIHLCGRSDDMFVFNSMNIYPQEIESQIREYPSITDVAVIPKLSASHGNIPVALIVFDKNIKPKLPDLKKYMKKKVGVRCPRQFIIVDAIPRNTAGKITRSKVTELSSKSEDVRKRIIQALGERGIKKFKPSLIDALIKGEADIKLSKFELDSLARMDLLVALEVDYEAVITPAELTQFRYLGHLVARVLSNTKEVQTKIANHEVNTSINTNGMCHAQHHIVRLIRRAVNFCSTVTHFNIILETLGNRITPLEIEVLSEYKNSHQVLSENASDKYHEALSLWLQNIIRMMLESDKHLPEKFVFKRTSPHVRYFMGPGNKAEKTLMICFAGRNARNMSMPNTVLLQHTDATCYDLLIISEPLNQEYRDGVPHLGVNASEVIQWVMNLEMIQDYGRIRTVGCSAGAHMAIVLGYKLRAELIIAVGAIFHKISQPRKYLERLAAIWNILDKKNDTPVLLTYSKGESRDKHCARIISMLTGGNQIIVEHDSGNMGHDLLKKSVDLNKLAMLLAQTIYVEINNELIKSNHIKAILNLSHNRILSVVK
ncbi:MAG: class I adenylate-forming enzyme family protein [Gammaproteobacteria bacterium]